ncbi:M23 family metallopeptidase [Patescibacteria group bacterium]|nr:M23 family metallopeptidase [Patescibacteria group bacterium]
MYSARDGIVYFVANNKQIGINWIMIVHTNGYVTVYQYMNEIEVQP